MVRAHPECFIANSVNAEIAIEPEIVDSGGSAEPAPG
jgi:hypothetical protein